MQLTINVLEPKCWDDGGDPDDTAAPEAFRKSTLLAQHVSFLKDFFRAYKAVPAPKPKRTAKSAAPKTPNSEPKPAAAVVKEGN